MNKVKDALRILIQGESEAVDNYYAFSIQANSDGYRNISILFNALVMAEKIHIKNHYSALGEEFLTTKKEGIKVLSTLENIKAALIGEVEENKELYPRLIKSIKTECRYEYGKVARLSMNWAKSVEKEHAKLLKLAYTSLKSGKDIEYYSISICQVCGNVVLDKKPGKECSVCGHDSIFFKSIPMEDV